MDIEGITLTLRLRPEREQVAAGCNEFASRKQGMECERWLPGRDGRAGSFDRNTFGAKQATVSRNASRSGGRRGSLSELRCSMVRC